MAYLSLLVHRCAPMMRRTSRPEASQLIQPARGDLISGVNANSLRRSYFVPASMSPFFFWFLLVSASLASILFTLTMPLEPIPILVVALAWLATFGLAYKRWSARSINWLLRMAAVLVSAILVFNLHSWALRGDVFIDHPCGCEPRTGTFWPLFFSWLTNIGLLGYAILGTLTGLKSIAKPTPRSISVWLLVSLWTAACVRVFSANITSAVLVESLRIAGILVGSIAGTILAIIGIGWLLSIPGRRRRKQADADFQKIDENTRQELLTLIDSHSRKSEFVLLYRFNTGTANPASMARVGGNPLARESESWPHHADGSPATFLLQLPLLAPRLPAPWQGRLIAVFLVDYGLLIRSYDAASVPDLTALRNPQEKPIVAETELQPLAIPYVPVSEDEEEEDEESGFDVGQLLERVPGLKDRLGQFSEQPVALLSRLIAGNNYLSSEDTILVGGDPQLIQNPHDAACPICQRPMRFLFQFCDVTETFALGDCGVGYVYGCDDHPEHCEGFVDCF
ncbi:MAG TPA: DUF1963 domain-containing protein [Gallionellaceae bacterium]